MPPAAAGGSNTSTILAEVCKVITNPDTSGNGYYPVYTDKPRGNAGYCAWHSAGTCGGKTVQFAFFFKLDGDAGCDPQDTQTGPFPGTGRNRQRFRDTSCRKRAAIRHPPERGTTPAVRKMATSARGLLTCRMSPSPTATKWKLQGEWSNAAYNAGTRISQQQRTERLSRRPLSWRAFGMKTW